MSTLTRLPQDTILWGREVLRGAISRLDHYGMVRPITFTTKALTELNRKQIEPFVKNSVGSFADLPAHVPEGQVRAALDARIFAGARSIIALGGGSILDAAKAVSYLHHREKGGYLPIVALPTTLSGSEFSHYFGVTESQAGRQFKRSYAEKETVPKLAVLDPLLIADTPRELLLASSIKALDHAIEGMREVEKDHPHAIMSASGLARLLRVLQRWPHEMETQEAIERKLISFDDLLQLQLGSWHCYFCPASVVYGLSHRIGHILGGTFGLPHSVTSCISLAPVIRACADFYGDKLSIFVLGRSNDFGAELADTIESIVQQLGLPDRIGRFNVATDELSEIEKLLVSNYPKEVADLGINASSRLHSLLEGMW